MVCYDDRFIVKLAHDLDGIIVSNDTYRDLQSERPEWKRCIEERLLMYSFVNDKYVLSVILQELLMPFVILFLIPIHLLNHHHHHLTQVHATR